MTEHRRRPTLRDIASDTGLSTAAVSYALRGLQVPEQTQARVRASAERLGYQVDPIARALSSGRTNNIGVLCGALEDAWQQRVAAALGRGLLEAGRQALIVDAANDPQREASLARQLVDQRVDGLISLPVDPRAAHWSTIAAETVLVSIGDGLPGASTAAEVVFDNAMAVTDALTRLADAGHRDVTVLTAVSTGTPDRSAEAVVHQVAPTLGLRAVLRTAPHDLDGATAVATSVLTGIPRPTAILCLADSIAYGVYLAARGLNLDIPTDLSVMGYDDEPVSRVLTPPLSTYHWPVDELTESVVARTILAVDGGKRSRRKVLSPAVQLRDSIAPPSITPS
ncbi:LacI family transcriptional regulator [Jatrophihabitans sp. GAS493]|uniref:LacI family DNA-binding transcriptional regulator n=1 Tax=Jatrophihabitans sp. GAS493 TaxID=1907575 RepID=UPI000BB85A77|nr:LacI family DNA-binding transcriptional regulator [Jatrophihabitans sp. GAS493]SOD71525.1 LacI family transcriptional regulator [Jatrophihabitans sp. GAS493]